MTESTAGGIVIALFLLLTYIIFRLLLITWDTQVTVTREFMERQADRLATVVDINSTTDTGSDCLSYQAQVINSGDTRVADFSKMDVLVQYTNSSDSKIATRLDYSSDWSISMAPDQRDPNVWNPNETATIDFTIPSAPKAATGGTVLVVTPQGIVDSSYFSCTCTSGDTSFKSPAAQAADTGGNGDGFELDPTNAFADGGGNASNIGGDGDRHRYHDYGFSIKNSCAISGIEVRLDWWLDSLGGSNSMDVELSWDGGASWTAAKTDIVESTTEHTTILGSSSDTWGRAWAATEFTDASFRARLTTNGVGGRNYFLDWVPVKVYYVP